MKTKWYLSALIVVLTIFGIAQNQTSLPNQEVLVHFNTQNVTSQQSDYAITVIKQQLQTLEVNNINVEKGTNGQLKISYHSTLDVGSIKKILSKVCQFKLDYTSINLDKKGTHFPENNPEKDFNLDVYEIQNPTQGTSNSAGKCVLNSKQDIDRSSNTNFLPLFSSFNIEDIASFSFKKEKTDGQLKLVANHKTYNIPEVRAGPYVVSIS